MNYNISSVLHRFSGISVAQILSKAACACSLDRLRYNFPENLCRIISLKLSVLNKTYQKYAKKILGLG
jgi:hypothetical protein